jgi:hypothetical protein
MTNTNSNSFVIFGYSEIAEKFVPTAHGTFASFGEAHQHASANMKETRFEVRVAE